MSTLTPYISHRRISHHHSRMWTRSACHPPSSGNQTSFSLTSWTTIPTGRTWTNPRIVLLWAVMVQWNGMWGIWKILKHRIFLGKLFGGVWGEKKEGRERVSQNVLFYHYIIDHMNFNSRYSIGTFKYTTKTYLTVFTDPPDKQKKLWLPIFLLGKLCERAVW